MYNKYKSKYLKQKNMLGGTMTESEFVLQINQILLNPDKEKVFDDIMAIIEPHPNEYENFLYFNIFDNNKNKLIDIIFDLPVNLNKITDYIKLTFKNFISKTTISPNFTYLIKLIINSTRIHENFLITSENVIIHCQENSISDMTDELRFNYWIYLIILLTDIYKTNILLNDGIISICNCLIEKLKNSNYGKAFYYFINKITGIKHREVLKSMDVYNLSLDLDRNLDQITMIRDFNVKILENKLNPIIDKIISKPNIDQYESFILYIYQNTECDRILHESNESKESKESNESNKQLIKICNNLLDFLDKKNFEIIKNLINKPTEEITNNDKSLIYSTYLKLAHKYSDKKLFDLLSIIQEPNELLLKIKSYKVYYFPDSNIFNDKFWEGIFTIDELYEIKNEVESNIHINANPIGLLKPIIKNYYSNLSQEQNIVIYTIVLLVGLLNNKFSIDNKNKIIIKGGKALQFRLLEARGITLRQYESDDIDLLVVSEDPMFAKSFSYNFAILIRWILSSDNNISLRFPNTYTSNTENNNIVKISYIIGPNQFMALSDIDFSQHDSSKPNFFTLLDEINIPNKPLKYYIQNLEYFIIEKIYYFIQYFDYSKVDHYLSADKTFETRGSIIPELFYLRKFAKSLQYIFLFIYNLPQSKKKKYWIKFRDLFLKYENLGNIMEKLNAKINNPNIDNFRRIGILYDTIFRIQV